MTPRPLFDRSLSDPEPFDRNPVPFIWHPWMALLILAIALGIMCLTAGCAHAYTDDQAIKAIIGEAEGEPYAGKLAVGCAIRNRGSLKGVYGLHAPRVIHHKYSQDTLVTATLAWNESLEDKTCTEIIHGASYWEGDSFPTPSWALGMTITAHIGHQIFFRDELK